MKHILCAIMSLLLFVACTSEEVTSSVQTGGNESVTPSITLDQNYLNFDEHSDVQTISFSSTMDWTAELINDRADGWCSISATSGTAGSREIDVTVTENTSTDDRTASVIIKSGAISKTVRISQKQRDALTVTTSTFEIESTKGKIYIEVKANIDFEYTINGSAAEWITPIQTRALKTTKLGFNIAENNTSQRREGTITIHSGDLQEVVTVYQAGSEKNILLSKKEFVVSNEGEEISIDVTSSVDVELEMPDVDWITRNVSRAVSTNTYYFTVAENATYDQREAYITFKNTEKKMTERVKVTQIQKDAIVLAQSIYNIDKDGGALDFDIQTNVEIKISISEDAQSWITQVATRGLHTETLHFDIAPYDGDASRDGTITITGGDASQTITIRQRSELVILDTPKSNEIYYLSSDYKTISPQMYNIVSNIYDQDKGYGIITFNNNITSIGTSAFSGCSSLTSITIPDGVTSIGSRAFSDCSSLTSITIPEGVTSIGDSAFWYCSSLTSITIPDGVTSIGNSAFSGCSSLTSITIPDGVTSIGDYTFYGCSKLTSITIPEGVTSIGDHAFKGCYSLTSITIPEGVTSIGISAFFGCSKLTDVYCKATTPPAMGGSVFYDNADGRKIHVPAFAVDAYRTAAGWSDYADDIVEIEANDSYQGTLPILNKKEVASKLLNEWDKGGEGVGYHDLSGRNGGTPDVEGGGNIGYTTNGEWLAYTVYVANAGTYKFTLYGSSSNASGTYGGEYQWFLNDPYVAENALGPRFKQQSGGGWGGPWMPSEPVEFELNEGFQRIILYMHNGAHNLYNFTAEWAE